MVLMIISEVVGTVSSWSASTIRLGNTVLVLVRSSKAGLPVPFRLICKGNLDRQDDAIILKVATGLHVAKNFMISLGTKLAVS